MASQFAYNLRASLYKYRVKGELLDNLKSLIKNAKLRLLQLHYERKIGHLGGNLSALDTILSILYFKKPNDLFVLSKGHAAGALYIALWTLGQLTEDELNTFHSDNSKLAGHPVAGWHPNIPFSTGSLGHGLGLAAGVALGKKLKKENDQLYCLLSDGEWQEGSNWEALIFIAHHQLKNLTILIDFNGLQGFGSLQEIASLNTLENKLQAFNVEVLSINGHDLEAIDRALKTNAHLPKIIILQTINGKGVSFMENQMSWHYLTLNKAQYQQAHEELSNVCEIS